MGSATMRHARHRLPVELPPDRSLEEVILARKMMSRYHQRGFDIQAAHVSAESPERGNLAYPVSPANYLSQLPPESFVRETSSRLGKRPQSRAVRRASTSQGRHRHREGDSTPHQLRPLTGVSPPPTALPAFGFTDLHSEGSRPTTSSNSNRSPRRVRGGRTYANKVVDGDSTRQKAVENEHIPSLTDKCNALARRLQLVEAQLISERAVNASTPPSAPPHHLSSSSTLTFHTEQGSCVSAEPSQTAPYPTGDMWSERGRGKSTAGVEFVEDRVANATLPPQRGGLERGIGGGSFGVGSDIPAGFSIAVDPGLSFTPRTGEGRCVQRKGIRRGGARRMDAEARHCETVEKEIADRFEVITDGMEKLGDVFSGAAQILQYRVSAITTISSVIRMFLQRCRYLRARVALKTWRVDHSLPVLQALRGEVLRQRKIETGLQSLRTHRNRATLARVFKSWSTVIGSNEQRKYQLRLFQEKVARRQLFDLMRGVFLELKNHTVGPASSRELAKRGRARTAEARAKVVARAVARGESGLMVTHAMVMQEMARNAVELMQGKVQINLSRAVLRRLCIAVKASKAREVISTAHFRRWAFRRIMKGWRKWAALKANGLDRQLMTGYKGGVGLRYNPNKVAAFVRRREMLSVFVHWARKSSQLAMATRMQRKRLTSVAYGAFATWKAETKKTKQVKKIAVGMWADFSLKELGEPFRVWYIYAQASKRATLEHERMLRLNRRAKNRKMCHTILKAWKHLAVYGRIEGLYTRSQLMASLAEQKDHTLRLMGKVDELAGGLGDMEELAMGYRSQMIASQRDIQGREASLDRQTMALHHAEQEIVRLQSLLSSAADIAPHICKAIHKVAPDFNFQHRGLEPLTKARAEAMMLDEEVRVERLLQKRLAEKEAAARKQSRNDKGDQGQSAPSSPGSPPGSPMGAQTPQQQEQLTCYDGDKKTPTVSGDGSFDQNRAPVVAVPVVIIPTSSVQIQVQLPADPEAAVRAAVAASALAQGIKPPVLPRELVRLDRVEWVLRRTGLVEVTACLQRQEKERRRARPLELGGSSIGDSHGVGGTRSGNDVSSDSRSTAAATSPGREEVLEDVAEDGSAIVVDEILAHDETKLHGGGATHPEQSTEDDFEARRDVIGAATTDIADAHNSCSPLPRTVAANATADAQQGIVGNIGALESVEQRTSGHDIDGSEGDEGEGHEADMVAERLAAVFEFLRTGNSLLLPPDLYAEWESRPDLGFGLLAADDHAYGPHLNGASLSALNLDASSSTSAERATTSGVGIPDATAAHEIGGKGIIGVGHDTKEDDGSVWGQGGGVSSWRGLCRETKIGSGRPMTFHDLRMALTATAAAGRPTESTENKLERRIMEERRRVDEMTSARWGNERPQRAVNLYAPSNAATVTADVTRLSR